MILELLRFLQFKSWFINDFFSFLVHAFYFVFTVFLQILFASMHTILTNFNLLFFNRISCVEVINANKI